MSTEPTQSPAPSRLSGKAPFLVAVPLLAAVLALGIGINNGYVENQYNEIAAVSLNEMQTKSIEELQAMRDMVERYGKQPGAVDAVINYKLEELDYTVITKAGLLNQ